MNHLEKLCDPNDEGKALTLSRTSGGVKKKIVIGSRKRTSLIYLLREVANLHAFAITSCISLEVATEGARAWVRR